MLLLVSMVNIMRSRAYLIYTVIIVIYVTVTFFIIGPSCLRDGMKCLSLFFFHFPADIIIFPLDYLLLNPLLKYFVRPETFLYLVVSYIYTILGWLILGVLIGWVIKKFKKITYLSRSKSNVKNLKSPADF